MIKPISPSEIQYGIPEPVIETFNQMIQEKWNGKSVTIKQKDAMPRVIAAFAKRGETITSHKLYDMNWMDVEGPFQKAGWKVRYESPDRDESFDSYWTFSK